MAEKDEKKASAVNSTAKTKETGEKAAAKKPAERKSAPAKKETAQPEKAASKQAEGTPKGKATEKAEAKSAEKSAEKAKAKSAEKPAEKIKEKPAESKKSVSAAKKEKPAERAKEERVAAKEAPKNAPEAPAKDVPEEKPRSNRDLLAAVKAINLKHWRMILIGACSVLLILALVLGIVFGVRSCGSDFTVGGAYRGRTLVGYYAQQIGTTKRVKPVKEVKDGGLPSGYPKYGYSLNGVLGTDDDKVAARNALIAESSYLTATGTRNAGGGDYTWMDENGYLYKGTRQEPVPANDAQGNHRQLYKHTAAVGLYGGDVADNEPGIIKQVRLRPRGYSSYSVTGVYAPAGEVIKIEISEEDMNATGGLTIHIGQALYNGKANNIWTAKNQMQRFPVILNTMNVNKNTAVLKDGVYTAYVGSFVGGPLYIRNTVASFTATISGGVTYSHFILGYTTQAEYEANMKSSAPYFDMEVWQYGVLHSGPKSQAVRFSYDEMYKAAVLWEKVSLVTTTGSNQGIVFLYDPFVAAGAAVAFPGQSSVNCPAGWMSGSLNYKGIVTSGSWGNFHEYHHNFQGYGVGNGGEVTNNGMTLVSYALFTKISAARTIGSYGAAGLGGWNSYTSAPWALEQVLKIARPDEDPSNGNQGLALYATLLHNFGPDAYMQSKLRQQTQRYGQSYVGYLKAWQDITHNDMTYYFKDLLCGITEEDAQELKNPDYPVFVPVSSVYQTGRGYRYDGKMTYIKTMQPYVIPYGNDFTVDLNKYSESGGMYQSGSIHLPEGFSYKVKKVEQPQYGKLNKKAEGIYIYTPDPDHMLSGDIIVTLEVKKDDGAFEVQDIDLVLGFEQTHEQNKFVLERTSYTYTADKMYKDVAEAYENGYRGYTTKTESDNKSPVQNCNTDIWFYPKDYKDPASEYIVPDNTVIELRGKLYFKEKGKYRIFLRGRNNCAMYYSLDGGETYTLGGKITTTPNNSHLFRPDDAATYVDVELNENSWVYFKEVLLAETTPMVSYIGLGMAAWTEPMFTIVEEKDADGNVIATHYYNFQGKEVSAEEANNAGLMAPAVTAGSQPYVNAYRSTYEFPSQEFETDYFYTRDYRYSYLDETYYSTFDKADAAKGEDYEVKLLSNNPSNWGGDNISHLFDGNANTYWHSAAGVNNKPIELEIDLGRTVTVNSMTAISRASQTAAPKTFTLQVSENGIDYKYVDNGNNGFYTGYADNSRTVIASFADTSFRYFKLYVTDSTYTISQTNKYLILSEIRFSYSRSLMNGKLISSGDESMHYVGEWGTEQAESNFGCVEVGKSGASVEWEFEGTRFVIVSNAKYHNDFEVSIDGRKVDSEAICDETGAIVTSYISPLLKQGKHKIVITCKGEASIDGIAYWQET